MSVQLTFAGVPLPVMQAVIVECARQREGVTTNLADGPTFAPQVHCGGSRPTGEMLYTVYTPKFESPAALAVMEAADAAAAMAAALGVS